jgi:hypothetical protein
MSASFERSREGVTIPRIWLAVAFSILIHIAALWQALPHMLKPMSEGLEQGNGSLSVQLAPPPAPRAPPPEPEPEPAPKVIARPPPPKVRPSVQVPPVIALNKPPPVAPAQPTQTPAPPVEVAPPARPPADNDFSSSVAARQRARDGATTQPSPGAVEPAPLETEAARARRIATANLTPRQQVFGYDPAAGGGVFQIRQMGLNEAVVAFFGWNREIKRKSLQLIDVSRGNNSDIRIAVVRKMITIIREYSNDDFQWESRGRIVTLSARPRDNAGLEEFLLRDFFPDQAVAR